MTSDQKELHFPKLDTVWLLAISAACTLTVLTVTHRLFFHRLSHIPGPRLAAISHAYEFYHDAVRGGMYIWEIEKMHKKYGPVVRINPREIHIKDPYFYDEVYAPTSRKREKDPSFVGVYRSPTSMIATVSHDHHRLRRGLLNGFFSKKSVTALSSVVHEAGEKLMKRLEQAHLDDSVIQLDIVYAVLTADIISQYSWGWSSGFLEDENFRNDVSKALNELSAFFHVIRFLPVASTIIRALPRWLLRFVRPGATAVLDMQDMVAQSSTRKAGKDKQNTIFDALLDVNVPPKERSTRRLEDEGLVLAIAGTETTARALTVASYHVFSDKSVLRRLRSEIQTVMPTSTTKASWSELEQLPYLNAVVNEAIRVSHGPIFRSTRIAPTESLKYKDIVIPPGSPVSMSSYFVHMDPGLFPAPESFAPERWIEATKNGHHLNKFLVAFSKGSRSCLGMNLAYAELYMTLASMIRRFDMDLYETKPENIRVDRDMGIGQPRQGTFSVRAKITGVLTE